MAEPGPARGRALDADFSTLVPLRYRAFLVVVLVTLAPVVLVLLGNEYEQSLEARLLAEAQASAAREVGPPAEAAARVRALAEDAGARVRLLSEHFEVLALHDDSAEERSWRGLADRILGLKDRRSLSELDAELAPLSERPEFSRAARDAAAHGCDVLDGRRVLRCFAVQRLLDGRFLYVELARRRGTRALYEQRYQVLKISLFVLPGALLLAAWLSWRMIRPIERLRHQVRERAKRALPSADLPVERSDEFGELATAFNELLARLRARSEENEAFVADLAHEFKNPVAAIRAAAERLESGELDAARLQRIARVLDQSSRQLDTLLTQFLELASADAGMRGEERSCQPLSVIVENLVVQLRADERYQALRFELRLDSDAAPAIVESRITSAIRNLLENAADFASRGEGEGHVRVQLDTVDGRVRLEVEDSGPGVAAEDLPHVFDRFFTRRQGGTGLGLALVRAVVEAHGGQVNARSEPGHGASFSLELPLPRA